MWASLRELDQALHRPARRLFSFGAWPPSQSASGPVAVVGALLGQGAPPYSLLLQAPVLFVLALAAHALALTLRLVQHGGQR